MTSRKLSILLILLTINSLFSQIKGKIVDEKNQPIPFVNIAIENENLGTTSEENGSFTIHESDKNKKLVISGLGFEKKIVVASDGMIVVLKPAEIQLDEVVLIKKFKSKEIEIGKVADKVLQAFDNQARIDIKYFPYLPKYKKTKFINRIAIYTDSKIENAAIKIHLYKMDKNGFPGEELFKKDFIVSVKKGTVKNTFNLENFDVVMPKDGVFVGFEKLLIQKNKFEKTVVNPMTNVSKIQISYEPLLMIYRVEKPFSLVYSGGNWHKETNEFTEKTMVSEPAIHLILSN